MSLAVTCIGLLGLLVFGLGFATSLVRGRSNQITGVPDDPSHLLTKIVRAHGNTTEYAPMLGLLMLVSASGGSPGWADACMIAATAARYLLVGGMLIGSMEKANPLRFIGALGTYLAGFGLCVNVLL